MDWSQRLHSNRLNDKGWAVDSETFAGLVSEFLDSPEGEVYYKDVQFNEQKTQITSTELIKGFSKSIESAHDGISMMTDLRRRATDAAPELSPVVISDLFPIYEGLRVLKKDTIVNLAAVGAVVLFIISVMLMNVQAAFLVSLMLAFTDVLLIGESKKPLFIVRTLNDLLQLPAPLFDSTSFYECCATFQNLVKQFQLALPIE